jgi:tetratricopeptide (TPR) repeat protein
MQVVRPVSELFTGHDLLPLLLNSMKRRLRFPVMTILAIPLIAFATLSVHAQDRSQEPFRIEVDVVGKAVRNRGAWAEIQSQHFLVMGDASEKDLRLAASELELFRNQFAQLFPHAEGASSVPARVVVMREANGGSFLQPGPDVDYILVSAGQKLSGDLLRNYVPLLMRDSMIPVPLWFQTGIIEFFGTYRLDRLGNSRIVKLGLDEYKGNVKDKNIMPLSLLFAANADSMKTADADARKLFTSQSCALINYLIQSRRMSAASRFMNAMAEGQPLQTAFRTNFRMGLSTFEENFKNFIKVSRNKGWRVSFTGFSLNGEGEILSILYANENQPLRIPANYDLIRATVETLPLRLLSDAMAEYYRGDLLLHNREFDAAEVHLLNAIRMDERLSSAYASLGRLQTERSLFKLAHESLDEALKLDPENSLAHYFSALLLRKEAAAGIGTLSHRDVERLAKTALQKTVRFTPDFVEASEMLARSNMTLHEDLDVAARLVVEALKRAPGRPSLMITLAELSAAIGDKASAGYILQRMISSGIGDTKTVQEARDLLYLMNLTEAQKTAFGRFDIPETADGDTRSVETRLSSKEIDTARKTAKKKADKEAKVVRGDLTKVDCSKGLTLHIRIGTPNIDERVENVHTDTPADIDWVSESGAPPEPVECNGRIRGGMVAITYRPQRKGLTMGVPLVVEFLSFPD